jgi:hypothetical protein
MGRIAWLRAKVGNVQKALGETVNAASEVFNADSASYGYSDGDSAPWDQYAGPSWQGGTYSSEGMGQKRLREKLKEFRERYQRVVETIGDLSLMGDEDPAAGATKLAESGINNDIATMLSILREEDRQYAGVDLHLTSEEVGSTHVTYPCLEFVLEERCISVLCKLGCEDRPVGTMALIMRTVAQLLTHISHPLLPSAHVHRPISDLITAASHYHQQLRSSKSAGLQKWRVAPAVMVEKQLAQLLKSIWRKLRDEPAQVDFFLYVDQSTRAARFDIMSALLGLVLGGGGAGAAAREALLLAVTVRDARVNAFISRSTSFCDDMARELARRAQPLLEPGSLAAADDSDRRQWVRAFTMHLQFLHAVSLGAEEGAFEREGRKFESQVHRSLAGTGNGGMEGRGLAESLCQAIHRDFLMVDLQKGLRGSSEESIVAALTLACRVVSVLQDDEVRTSSPLRSCIFEFLLGGAGGPHGEASIRSLLLGFCNLKASHTLGTSSCTLAALRLMSACVVALDEPRVQQLLFGLSVFPAELSEAVRGITVDRSLIESFCLAFPGSAIHPEARNPAMGSYLREARCQQIQQLARRKLSGGQLLPEEGEDGASPVPSPSSVLSDHAATLETLCARGSLFGVLLERLGSLYFTPLRENLAMTGVMSSLAAAAAASSTQSGDGGGEVTRRLLLVLLFGGSALAAPPGKAPTMLDALAGVWREGSAMIDTLDSGEAQLHSIRSSMGVQVSGRPASTGHLPDGRMLPFLENRVLLEEFLKESAACLWARETINTATHSLKTQRKPREERDEFDADQTSPPPVQDISELGPILLDFMTEQRREAESLGIKLDPDEICAANFPALAPHSAAS